jgi:hypothetical protein
MIPIMRTSGFLLALCVPVACVRADMITLNPPEDTTLYEANNNSNGAGSHIHVGSTGGGFIRRGLLALDVSAIPAGSTINSAVLQLNMSRTSSLAQNVSLHRALSDWGEAGSDAGGNEGQGAPGQLGDATWNFRDYDGAGGGTAWTTQGGDFDPDASDTLSVAGLGTYSWGSPGTTADVQGWLDTPATNFGWILIGNESVIRTTKRFDSGENITAANRPQLTIDFTPIPEPGVAGLFILGGLSVLALRRMRPGRS